MCSCASLSLPLSLFFPHHPFGSSPRVLGSLGGGEFVFLRSWNPLKKISSFTLFGEMLLRKMKLPLAGYFSQHNLSILHADKVCYKTPSERWGGKRKRKEATKGRENPHLPRLCAKEAVVLSVFGDDLYKARCVWFMVRCWAGIGFWLLIRFWRKKQRSVQC